MSDRPEVETEKYESVQREIHTALQSVNNEIEAHELVCQQLHERFDHYSWVGIYVIDDGKLVLSAWSGPEETEHTTIEIGQGICGLAAKTGQTEIVPDVSKRPEFIACFPTTKSEIVVPIHDAEGAVVGEIDVDSDWLDAFDEHDRELLEGVAGELGASMIGT